MYQRDWLDDVRWLAIAQGVLTALLLQIILTLLVLRPLNLSLGWAAVLLVELSVALGAFVSGWRARHARMLNSLSAAMASAVLSLLASGFTAPNEIDLLSVLFLFGSFAAVGALSGWVASRAFAAQEAY